MQKNGDRLKIYCDEAGHTGPHLLSKDQRFFAFSSVNIPDEEAFAIIAKARQDNPVQMPELKAPALLRSERGRRLVSDILAACDGRFAWNAHEKLLALCGWFFEYIYEPVYQENPWLLYEKNLHRFVAMYTWLWMSDTNSDAPIAIEQFQRYMRSRDPKDAPFLFATARNPLTEDGSEHPFECILTFAYGYRERIIADNAKINEVTHDRGRWTLDLSASSLWSHLNYWGRTDRALEIICDTSKPLEAIVGQFTGDERDPAIARQRAKGNKEPLGWKLVKPVEFGDSRNHPAIQLADVIAGSAVWIYTYGLPEGMEAIGELLQRHALPDSIFPDMEIVDPSKRQAAVNALILYDMAKRAERNGDPYENLEEMYRYAEISWAKGDYNLDRGSR